MLCLCILWAALEIATCVSCMRTNVRVSVVALASKPSTILTAQWCGIFYIAHCSTTLRGGYFSISVCHCFCLFKVIVVAFAVCFSYVLLYFQHIQPFHAHNTYNFYTLFWWYSFSYCFLSCFCCCCCCYLQHKAITIRAFNCATIKGVSACVTVQHVLYHFEYSLNEFKGWY